VGKISYSSLLLDLNNRNYQGALSLEPEVNDLETIESMYDFKKITQNFFIS
jgi:hypothetical protein